MLEKEALLSRKLVFLENVQFDVKEDKAYSGKAFVEFDRTGNTR